MPLPRHLLRPAEMAARRRIPVTLEPSADERRAVAEALGIVAVRKLRLEGELVPRGRSDWRLEASLGATVVQACVVTLDPVTTRIDEAVERTWMADLPEPEGAEVELPEDDVEPLPPVLDLGAVMVEALALALPPYPRAEGAPEVDVTVAAPGVTPLSGEATKPFSGLAGLREKLGSDDGEE